jgi:2-hydroxycyclohexanecarboxyl-CoA dehydrogenase
MNDGRVAIVTGAASGIGKATGEHLTSLGWRVAGVDLHESSFERSVVLDVTERERYAEVVAAIEDDMGPVDLLASAAGYDTEMPIAGHDMATWDRMFDVLLGGSVNGCAAVLPYMKQRRRGSIVIVSSELGLAGEALYAAYASAKGAVNGFVKALALEAIEYGVHVNAVAPGPADTPLIDGTQWRDPDYLATLPLGRLVRPSDIAGTISLLADEDAYFVGEILSPNAGAVI